jgi:hypothetical protein
LIDLQGKGFKKQTDSWKYVKTGIMKHVEQFTAADHDYIQNIMQDISKVLGQAVEDFTQAHWTKTFVSTQDIVSNRNKNRIIRIFGLSLANSNPANLFNKPLFDGSKLLDSSITCAWAAAYLLYGSGWRPEKDLIDVGTSITPTKLFSSCNKNTVLTVQSFASGDVFTEDPQSLHNLEVSMKKWLKMKATGEVLDPGTWAQSMTTKFSNPKIQHACLRLAKTPVSIFADLKFLKGNDLDKISITSIWMGAHLILGDLDKVTFIPAAATPTTNPISKAHAPMSNRSPNKQPTVGGVGFTMDTNAAQRPGSSTRFLSGAKPKLVTPTGYKSKRSFAGFWKVKLPAATEAYGQKSIEEILQHWGNLIDLLSTIDKKIEILGWNETLNIKPHMKGSLPLTSRDHLQKYVANVFSRIGMNTWLRFRMAHDVDKDLFLDSAAFDEAHLQLSYDKVQAKVTTAWGWMLGAIPKTANFQDMKELYENHPLLKEFQIEARQQSI